MTVSTTAILTIRRAERKRANRLFRSPTAVLSLIWLIGLTLASLTSPLWLRYGPLEQDLTAVLQGPSAAHILGTDELGRGHDARQQVAAASTMAIGLIPPIVAVAITVPVTLWAVRSRRAEGTMNRISEIVMSLPGTVIILASVSYTHLTLPTICSV